MRGVQLLAHDNDNDNDIVIVIVIVKAHVSRVTLYTAGQLAHNPAT